MNLIHFSGLSNKQPRSYYSKKPIFGLFFGVINLCGYYKYNKLMNDVDLIEEFPGIIPLCVLLWPISSVVGIGFIIYRDVKSRMKTKPEHSKFAIKFKQFIDNEKPRDLDGSGHLSINRDDKNERD